MKKTIAMLLTAALSASLLSGCVIHYPEYHRGPARRNHRKSRG